MYGRVEKCKEIVELDNEFIKSCDKMFPNRQEASKYYGSRGWNYIDSNDLNTAMKRFNQAWMLDSNNASVYWGFGVVLGKQKQYQESIPYFERALSFDSNNANLYQDAANSYYNYSFSSKDKRAMLKGIECIEHAIKINPDSKRNYRQLTVGYYYLEQADSVKKYLGISDAKDSSLIESDLREELNRLIQSSK